MMSRACIMHKGEEKCIQGFGGERCHLGTDVRLILKCILKKQAGKEWNGLIWLRLGFKKQAVVNTVVNLWVPHNDRNFLIR
jgi:hypothetical protein